MKRIGIILLLFISLKSIGQTTGYLRFDTVLIYKQGGTAELILRSSTKDSLGVLVNYSDGRTRFMKSKVINDSTFVVGLDTLVIRGTGSGGGSSTTTIVRKPILVYAGSGSNPDTLDLAIGYGLMRNPVDSSLQVDSSLFATQFDISTIGGGGDTLLETNAQDYGVICDGTTDITLQFQAALDAAGTNGRPTLVLPEGVCMIRTAYRDTAVVYKPTGIQFKYNGVTLKGKGIGRTIIKAMPAPVSSTFTPIDDPITFSTNTSWNHILWATDVSNIIIRDLSVHGNLANQINYDENPYLTPQDSTYTDSVETDGIKFLRGSHNLVYNVRIDSIPGYGIANFGSTNTKFYNMIITTSVNGAAYFTRNCYNSGIYNSYITDIHCDGVRVRSSYVDVIGNEISWTKKNPSPILAQFAGVYLECDSNSHLMPRYLTGVRILNNYLHNNSSFGIDCFMRDTSLSTYRYPSFIAQGNIITSNANAGITVSMPFGSIKDNLIYDNGADSTGYLDPYLYTGCGISVTARAFGVSITGNTFRDTRGFQQYAIKQNATSIPKFMTFHSNTQSGGLDINLTQSSTYNNPWFNNPFLDSAGVIHADALVRTNGNVWFTPKTNGLDMGDGVRNFFAGVLYPSGGESGFVGQQGTGFTNHLGLIFGSNARYGGTSGTTGRHASFYDFQGPVSRGGFNASGELYWGLNSSTFAMRIKQRGVDLHSEQNQAHFVAAGSGSTANSVQTVGFYEFNSGYTGSGTIAALRALNHNVVTGNNIGPEGGARSAWGLYSGADGASTSGSGIGVFGYSLNALRNVGVIGTATVNQVNNASAASVGVMGYALRNTQGTHTGGYFGLMSTQPTLENGALIANNGGTGHEILKLQTNGTNSFIVRTNGNTAIGTTATTSAIVDRKFYVSGSIGMHIDSSETITTIGSDYVQAIDATTGKFKKITAANLGIASAITSINGETGAAQTLTAANGLTRTTTTNNVEYKLGGTLGESTTINGAGQDLSLGASGNSLASLTVRSTAAINLYGTLHLNQTNTATDANYNVLDGAAVINLIEITANRTVSLPTATAGKIFIIWNQNSGAFNWSFGGGGATVTDAAGNSITTLTNDTVYILLGTGSAFLKIN